jgi:hypothetical protein
MYNEGIRTFTANGALTDKMRVKLTSASVTSPIQVEAAGAGEQHIGITDYAAADGTLVAVKLRTYPGTHEGVAGDTFAVGATLYGGALGAVKTASDGSAIGIALEAATATGDIIEFIDFTVISTLDSTISFTDTHSLTSAATVMAALDELYQNAISIQGFIPIPLATLREAADFAVANIAANGGLLASDTTPVLGPAVASPLDGCQVVSWAASNNDPVIFQVPLPPDLDDDADLVIHMRIKSAGTTNAVGFACDAYFNEGDVLVEDNSTTNQTATWAEKIITIAAADIPAGAQTLSVSLTPVAHTTDIMYLSALWIEYKTKIKTS